MSVGYTLMSLQLLIACITGIFVYKFMSKGRDSYDEILEEISRKKDA